MPTNAAPSQAIKLRTPVVEDGKAIWELVKSTKVLDLNSSYNYIMLSKYFSDTCVVADAEGKIAGYISAFCSPIDPEVLFIWQVAVDEAYRRRKLGMIMLKHLLERESCRQVRFYEITVAPSNKAADALYRKFAADLGVPCEVAECFPARLFPGGQHEEEMLYRIGPFPK
jgi:L-2,4-diaminobutyric acid acetyltransferase